MANPNLFYNLFSPDWLPPITSIWPRIVQAGYARRPDSRTAIFDPKLHFAVGHNAGRDLTSESGNEDDDEARASGRSYKNCHLLDHIDLNYCVGNLEFSLTHPVLCVGRCLVFEMVGDSIRWY